jgi:hypothetical protein
MSLSKSPDVLGTYAVVASYILMIGGMMMMVLFGTTDSHLTGNILILSLSGILLVGGLLLRVLGAFLWGPGSRRYREEHNVLEIVTMRHRVTISELQTETGYPIERIEQTSVGTANARVPQTYIPLQNAAILKESFGLLSLRR